MLIAASSSWFSFTGGSVLTALAIAIAGAVHFTFYLRKLIARDAASRRADAAKSQIELSHIADELSRERAALDLVRDEERKQLRERVAVLEAGGKLAKNQYDDAVVQLNAFNRELALADAKMKVQEHTINTLQAQLRETQDENVRLRAQLEQFRASLAQYRQEQGTSHAGPGGQA